MSFPLSEGFSPGFVLGEDGDFNEWLVHLNRPRFACRVREDDFTQAEIEAADEHFIFEFGGGSAFSHFIWIDPQPPLDELNQMLQDAADFVEAMDEA